MDKYNSDLLQAIKWLEVDAPNIQELVQGYQDWRTANTDTFWANWMSSAFSIDSANSFGLMVWCIILGVPSELVGLTPNNYAWAFGDYRKNYIYENISYDELTNGDFANEGYAWNQSTTLPFNPALVSFEEDTADNVGGIATFSAGTTEAGVVGNLYQTIDVTPGATYTIQCISKFSSDAEVTSDSTQSPLGWINTKVKISDSTSGKTILSNSINNSEINDDWATTSATLTIPSGVTSINVELRAALSSGSLEVQSFKLLREAESAPAHPDKVGGNFFGVAGALTGTEEVRFLLKLRYASLVSNGRFIYINRMLNWIINKGEKKQSPDDNIIVVDNTATSVSNPVSEDYTWQYRIGKNVTLSGKQISSKLIKIMETREYGIAPSIAGVAYSVIQE